jgi:hypothetical protein
MALVCKQSRSCVVGTSAVSVSFDSLSRYRAVDLPCFRPVALPHYRSEKRWWRCDIRSVGSFELLLALTGARFVTLSTALCPQRLPAVASQVVY